MEYTQTLSQEALKTRIQQIKEQGYEVNISKYFQRGIEIFKIKPLEMILAMIIYMALSYIPLLTWPASAGLFLYLRKAAKTGESDVGHIFKGFDTAADNIIAGIVTSIFIFLGFLVFIIPGIYLAVAYAFFIPFIAFFALQWRESMTLSYNLVKARWWQIFGLFLVLGLFNFAGLLAFGIGLLFTIPITQCIIYAFFEDVIINPVEEIEKETSQMEFEEGVL